VHGWWAASYLVLWLLVIVLAVVVVALARQIGTLHMRLGPRGALEMDDEGPALGEAPEARDLVDLRGATMTVGGPGPQQLLLFVSPGCGVCEQVLPALPAIARNGHLKAYVVTDADEVEAELAFGHRNVPAPVIAAPDLIQRYNVPGTPYVVLTDRLGIVRAKGTVNNLEQVEGLVDTAQRRVKEAMTEGRAVG
jgi:methylamine dehydrogenase accessory protein MauD